MPPCVSMVWLRLLIRLVLNASTHTYGARVEITWVNRQVHWSMCLHFAFVTSSRLNTARASSTVMPTLSAGTVWANSSTVTAPSLSASTSPSFSTKRVRTSVSATAACHNQHTSFSKRFRPRWRRQPAIKRYEVDQKRHTYRVILDSKCRLYNTKQYTFRASIIPYASRDIVFKKTREQNL